MSGRKPRKQARKSAAAGAPHLPPDRAPAATQPVRPPPPIVSIEVDPAVSGGFINGRFDMLIRGRVVSASPAEEIALHVGGEVVSVAQFGDPDHAAPIALADGTRARLRAFHFNLPRLLGDAGTPCRPTVVARSADGTVHEQAFELAVDPHGPEPVTLIAGPRQIGGSVARPPVILYVERATLDGEGNLQVHGWAIALTTIVTVQVYAGDNHLGAARLGGEREDVAAVYAAYPNARASGFSMVAQLRPDSRGVRAIRAQAIGLHGFSHEIVVPLERIASRPARPIPSAAPTAPLAPPPAAQLPADAGFSLLAQQPTYQIRADFRIAGDPLDAALFSGGSLLSGIGTGTPLSVVPFSDPAPPPVRHDIHMFCDSATLTADGYLTVAGWATSEGGIASVYVYLDDVLVGEAAHGRERPDVGQLFAHIPAAGQAGFLFDRRVIQAAVGEHVVRLLIRSNEGEEKSDIQTIEEILPAAPPAIGTSSAGPAEPHEFRLEMDSPRIEGGAATEAITGRLTIEGWVLARSGVAGIDVRMDGQSLGEAHCGLARQDVAGAFPDWEDSLRSGYAFHCPPRSLRDGDHEVALTVRANNGAELRQSFTITVKKAEDQDDFGTIRRRVKRVESDLYDSLLADLAGSGPLPRFALFLRQSGPVDPVRLAATLNALRLQCYPSWHLTVMADASGQWLPVAPPVASPEAEVWASFGDELAARVSVLTPDDAAWQTPLAPGDALAGLLCPGDELGADALAELALASLLRPDAAFYYADEARLSPASHEREPFFKPDFSPDLLLSTNYIGHPWVARPALMRTLAISPAGLSETGEYDLILRATEQAGGIYHLPKLLCSRGMPDLDTATASEAALLRAAARRGSTAEVLPAATEGTWRLKRAVDTRTKVSIIIPTCAAHGYIETCLDTLRARTSYSNYETIVVDNIPDNQMAWKVWVQNNADKVVDMPDAFNWSRFNNLAVDVADGEYLLFLNDDIEFEQDDWLDVLMEHAQRPEVGIVGARLLYPDRKVQHAGMFLANNGIGRHAFRFAAEDEPGYFGLALTQRNVMAVTGACMLMRRTTFEALGRFDEAHEIVNNDLDFCLRAHNAGLLTVFTPYATLIHHELASRDRLKDVFDLSHFNAHWKTLFAAGDPYFSPKLSRQADDYRPDDEATEAVFAGHPLFHPDDIKRILVVKLDHIGDFVTALPAIRALKHQFPQARISVLAGPASRTFASMEPAIDEFIEFSFFHARSQLGERTLTATDYAGLGERLKPNRFDLAVDLRKHLSTRDVLRHTGARFLAGFDYMGQFPFLDIALEWDGDKTLHRKRGHVVDDLLSLVATIATAATSDRLLMQPTPQPTPVDELPDYLRPLFDRPVVAIHAGAGNITKQWPEEHFIALIDLLVEQNGVNVMLVGGGDEMKIADDLLAGIARPDRVASMVGQTTLTALPRLLAACALYIGNDSGPKHIAAALGVPTIGIHSGVVDAAEWGPVGRRAVALQRNMTCSPCYLAVAADCPRGLACLRFLEPTHVHRLAETMLARPILAHPVYAARETASVAMPVARGEGGLAQPNPATVSPALGSPEAPAPATGRRPRKSRRREIA